jgi:hypothetical protein
MGRAFFATLLLLASHTASPHPGGTNADGCHTNHKTGDYHCHGNPKPRAPDAVTYCHVVKGENRCGYALKTCADLTSKFGGVCKPQ